VIADIERLNVAILILGSLASLVVMREFKYFFSFASGSAIVTLNFRLIRNMVERTFNPGVTVRKTDIFRIFIKFLFLAALVIVILVYGKVDIQFFLAGLSTVFLAIVLQQLYGMFRTKGRKEDGTSRF
jgi:hypothetical protein